MYTQHTHTHTHIHCMRLQWLHCLSPTLHENSGCSTCLPTLDVLSLFNNSYSSISVVTLYILCAWIIFNFFFFKLRYGLPCGSAGIESACNVGDLSSIPGLGRSLGEGKGSPLQYSGLENSMDCIVHGIAKSWTRLSDFHTHSHT